MSDCADKLPPEGTASRHPVIHLAESPDLVGACRRRVNFGNVILVFRDARAAWPEWRDVVERPKDAIHHADWNIRQMREFQSPDGFRVIWLELKPLEPAEAALLPGEAGAPAVRARAPVDVR